MKQFKFPTSKPDLTAVAQYLSTGTAKSIVVMVGAGISTAAGIPDFRSPKTGLYHNLSRLNLPYAEAVFDIDYFRRKPEAFYMLAQELYPGKFRPTMFHSFLKLLEDRGVLRRVYTQNIDTLEEIAGVSPEKVVYAHGSFATNHCIDCHKEMSKVDIEAFMKKDDIPKCSRCGGYVKPDIVFFGENLPARFFKLLPGDLDAADLVIVAGTSLQVHPFASLPSQVSCPRVLFNLESVGDFGRRKTDVIKLGPCDEGIEQLVELCKWDKQLKDLWTKTAKTANVAEEEDAASASQKKILKALATTAAANAEDASASKEESSAEEGSEEEDESLAQDDLDEVQQAIEAFNELEIAVASEDATASKSESAVEKAKV
ncbi:DHS-like NAD/FAD-binding domain-containing protein [Limtongia smithiae]|uniref:DHS-like NAD/FAD-binding domain-containing protein n=1 Tax=Limtongia smithiae TaxID=1125753 RepID=UPI0034CD0AE4